MDTSQFQTPGSSCSGMCGKVEGEGGTVLKLCAGCKVMAYCSRECQKAAWPKHKQYCSKQVGKNILPFARRMLAKDHPLSFWVHMCIVQAFPITQRNMRYFSRLPLYAEMDIGVEPADITQLFKLQRAVNPASFDHNRVEGMVQVHSIANLEDLPSNRKRPSPEMTDAWTKARAAMDQTGLRDSPLVILRFVDGFQKHQSFQAVSILMPAIEEAWKPRPLKNIIRLFVSDLMGPNHIKVLDMMNYMNELIREDTNNKLRMRTAFRECDKKLLIDAGFQDELEHVQMMLRCKLFREPVYHQFILDHIQEACTPMESFILEHHGKWEAEEKRRGSLPRRS